MADIQQAIDMIQRGRKKEAGPILEGFIRSNPQDVTSWFWYAETLDSDQKRVQLLEAYLKQNPGNAQVIKALEMLRVKLSSVQPASSISANIEADLSSNMDIEQTNGKVGTLYENEGFTGESNFARANWDEPDLAQEYSIPNIHIEANEKVMAYLKEVNPFSEIISPYSPKKVNKNHTHSDFIGHFDSMSSLPQNSKYVVYGCEALVHPETGIIFGFIVGTSAILRIPENILKELLDKKVSDLQRAMDSDSPATSQLEGNWASSWSFTEKLVHKCFGYYGMDPRVQSAIQLNFEEDYRKLPSPKSAPGGWLDRLFPLGILFLVLLMIALVILVLFSLNIF